jgi:hypothetical protein
LNLIGPVTIIISPTIISSPVTSPVFQASRRRVGKTRILQGLGLVFYSMVDAGSTSKGPDSLRFQITD